MILFVCQHLIYFKFKLQTHVGAFSMLLSMLDFNRNASERFDLLFLMLGLIQCFISLSWLSVALLFLLTAVETDGSAWYRPLATRDHHLFFLKYKWDWAETSLDVTGSTGPFHKNRNKTSTKISREQNIYQTLLQRSLQICFNEKQINILGLAVSV